jgi:hypothetical protein
MLAVVVHMLMALCGPTHVLARDAHYYEKYATNRGKDLTSQAAPQEAIGAAELQWQATKKS